MKNRSRGLLHFLSAFRYSLSGLRMAVMETAVRQEICLGAVHFVLLYLLDVGWQWCVCLTALWALVLIVEIVNTAIEAVVDLVSPDFNALAGRAKDLGSAAVFLSLVVFACAWAVVICKCAER